VQGAVRCPGLVFVTQAGRTIYDLRGEEHEDINIVESPAKARILGNFLSKGYTVKASVGHIRDLPPHEMGVDVDTGSQPSAQASSVKQSISDYIKAAKNQATSVSLTTIRGGATSES
jgi:DNA topoisomerase-1